jgi:LacI family repressor for deo operon, udp, cdd, tsx, nupC, and nupG
LAVQHLAAQGCRRIATITGPLGNTLSQDRLRGYRQGLLTAGLPWDGAGEVEGSFSIDSGYTAMQRLLDGEMRPDGLFCANDEMAIGAQRAIRERGLTMPSDIAVIGFDDLRFGAFAAPPLTTIRQPTTELGETAMRMLDAVLHNRPLEQKSVVLLHELVVRESTARA